MAPICAICCDRQINYGCKCDTCKKSLCIDCFDKIIIRTNDETYNYKCPFCTNDNEKEIEELQPKQIIKLCDRNINNDTQKIIEENIELIEQVEELNSVQSVLGAQLLMYINKIKGCKEYIKNMEENQGELKIQFQNLLRDYETSIIENGKLKASIPEVKTKKINKYQEFVKENFKNLKHENPDKSHQIIFKMLGSKWKNKK